MQASSCISWIEDKKQALMFESQCTADAIICVAYWHIDWPLSLLLCRLKINIVYQSQCDANSLSCVGNK